MSLGVKAGYDRELLRKQLPRTDEIPFDTQHQFMATLHHSHEDGTAFAYIKGAPERLLTMCSRQRELLGEEPLDRDVLARSNRRHGAAGKAHAGGGDEDRCPKASAISASRMSSTGRRCSACSASSTRRAKRCLPPSANVTRPAFGVKMITGDHAATAEAIARELKLAPDPKTITGQALDQLDDTSLRKVAREVTVFARTSPMHKLRLVRALQADDAVTAMTGDGVNDAPALKRADIGVAMGGKGTEAAKEAAELVLADDNFASIVAAVREGRTVYDNLRKVIEWTLPTNGGEASAIVGAIALGLTLPVTAIQILWINLVTAVTLGLALAFEPTEPGTMRRPPRSPDEPLLTRRLLWRVGFVSVLFVMGAFGIFFYAIERNYSVELARTMVVNTIVVMEIFYLFNVRYIHGSSLTWQGVLGTRAILISVCAVVIAQFAFTYVPFMQEVFKTEPVSVLDGVLIVGIGVAVLIAVEVEKRLLAALSQGQIWRSASGT